MSSAKPVRECSQGALKPKCNNSQDTQIKLRRNNGFAMGEGGERMLSFHDEHGMLQNSMHQCVSSSLGFMNVGNLRRFTFPRNR
jgi:hypothetical protein